MDNAIKYYNLLTNKYRVMDTISLIVQKNVACVHSQQISELHAFRLWLPNSENYLLGEFLGQTLSLADWCRLYYFILANARIFYFGFMPEYFTLTNARIFYFGYNYTR